MTPTLRHAVWTDPDGPAPDPGRLRRLLATGADPGLEAHVRYWGRLPAGSRAVVAEVERAGLRGRGGAAFPTAVKLQAVARRRGAVVVANGTEGEPASAKDRTLMSVAPHLVLDGVSLAAESVGATEAIIAIDRTATRAIAAVTTALAERAAVAADTVPIRIAATPPRYVTGEESALINWINGGEAIPTFVPPRPSERGVRRRPTLVDNVETLAHLALIARFGADWFRTVGTAADPGTALVTLSGWVAAPGVHEIGLGTRLTDVLRAAGAPPPAAVLVGGYAGRWISGDRIADVTLDPASLSAAGGAFGCGAVSVLGTAGCGLIETARVAHWMAAQSAGQCGPCVNGLPAIARALDALVAGDHRGPTEADLHRWLGLVEGRGACHHPDGVAGFVRSALATFADEIHRHRLHGPCRRPELVLPIPPVERGRR
jgi:NADH:ubiquinone oxidoreductase subunit F (NADH-binding)